MRDGWVEYKFKDVAKAVKGKLPKTKNEEGIGIPYLTANFLRSSKPDYWIENIEGAVTAEDGDCLILWDGAGAGDLFSAHRGVVSSTMAVVTTQNSKILREFLTLFISSKAEYIKETCRGTTVPHVSPDAIANMDLKIPPLSEQKRIVDLISSVDSYIEALQQQLESAKRSRNAVLHELLTAGGDDWVEHKLIDMFEIYQPQTIAKSLMSDDGEFIVFGANGPIGRYHEFNHEEPEVVVTCRGATCGTINMTPPKTWITGNAMVVSPKTSEVSKGFLYWALVAGVDIQSVVSGSAQPQITREGLAPVKIKIPPLSRQKEIVDLISGFELNISHSEESLNKTKALRSGLLADLLSGEHEIPASYDKVMGAA